MDHFLDKEFECNHPAKCCGQRPYFCVESSDELSPSGVHIGGYYLTSSFRDMDSGIVCGEQSHMDALEGSEAIQKDHDRLEKWACESLTKFSIAKCKVLCLDRGDSKHGYRLRDAGIERSPLENDLGVPVD